VTNAHKKSNVYKKNHNRTQNIVSSQKVQHAYARLSR